MRHLGIDFGTKKIGLALSDEAGTMGFPHATLQNDAQLLAKVRELIAKENVGKIVVGDSKDSSGKDNPVAKAAKEFAKELHTQTGVPVEFMLEAYSTQEARRMPEGERVKSTMVDAS